MASLTLELYIFHVFLLFGLVFVSESDNSEQQRNLTAGDDVTLQCRFSKDDKLLMLVWTRPDLQSDSYVFFYRGGRPYDKYHHPQFQDRVSITEINEESLTVTLHNVIVTDTGRYECHVTVEGTGRNKRAHSEVKDVIKLTVSPKGQSGNVGLAVGLSVAVVLIIVAVAGGFVIYLKRKISEQNSNQQSAVEDVDLQLINKV